MTALNKTYLKDKAYINGSWAAAKSGKSFAVLNPANSAEIGQVPDMAGDDAVAAIDSAAAALPSWKALTGKERSKILYDWYESILESADDLAVIMTAEQGKPLAEAKGEVLGGAAFVQWAAEEAKRVYGDYIPAHKSDSRIVVSREAVGVVGAVTPWNFPSSMITRKLAPALAAGCTAVLKPAEDTPLSALALSVLAEKSGIPAGVLNIVTTSEAVKVGDVLTSDSRVRKISFTGSTNVGRFLMRQSADSVKKVSLELGGNAPFIVFESADIDKAVDGAMASKFRNAGQTCVCANRLFIHESVFDAFKTKLIERTKALKVGPGDQEGVEIGPLINEAALEKVGSLIQEAIAKGAKVECGGNKHELGGTFFEPTVMTNMDKSMRLGCEEIFGPVAPLYGFKDESDVIARANDTEYGLAAYMYTTDQAQSWRVSEALEYGMVGINEPLLATELAPFGGIKQSGIGREGSMHGIDEFTELKYRLFGGL